MTELTIDNIVYYVIPGGRPTLDKHPYEVPLILYNQPLEKIMRFGDDQRAAGRTPSVIIPCENLGGLYATINAWKNHVDPSGILDNVPAHIEGYFVDFTSTERPETPGIWSSGKPAPEFIFWERLNQEVYFKGSHNEFIQMFGFDPEDMSGDLPQPGTGTPGPALGQALLNIKVDVYHHNQGG